MLVAVVARHGQIVFSHAVGDRRPGGPPLSVDDIFPLASQTKPMTAATLLALVERGLVGPQRVGGRARARARPVATTAP